MFRNSDAPCVSDPQRGSFISENSKQCLIRGTDPHYTSYDGKAESGVLPLAHTQTCACLQNTDQIITTFMKFCVSTHSIRHSAFLPAFNQGVRLKGTCEALFNDPHIPKLQARLWAASSGIYIVHGCVC